MKHHFNIYIEAKGETAQWEDVQSLLEQALGDTGAEVLYVETFDETKE